MQEEAQKRHAGFEQVVSTIATQRTLAAMSSAI